MKMVREASLVLGTGVLVAWLAASAGSGGFALDRPDVAPAGDPAGASVVTALQADAARLRAYLENAPRPPLPARDPFHFASGRVADSRSQEAASAPAEAPLAEPPAVAPLALVGLAEDTGPDGPVRTAVLSGMGQLFLVNEGEEVAGRFRVLQIGSDSVQLLDLASSDAVTLRLK